MNDKDNKSIQKYQLLRIFCKGKSSLNIHVLRNHWKQLSWYSEATERVSSSKMPFMCSNTTCSGLLSLNNTCLLTEQCSIPWLLDAKTRNQEFSKEELPNILHTFKERPGVGKSSNFDNPSDIISEGPALTCILN